MSPADALSRDEIRCLRSLRQCPRFDGALPLILGGLTSKDPHEVMRGLAKKGLVQWDAQVWSLTAKGEQRADEADLDGR